MVIRDTWDFAAEAINRALGDEITWKPGTAEELLAVPAVYGDGFERVQSGEVRISSRSPEITVASGDLDGQEPTRGDELTVRGETFVVVSARSDVEAVSWTLILKRT